MSSSGSRGPPVNRYNGDDYHRIKRKPFYPSRRNLSASGPNPGAASTANVPGLNSGSAGSESSSSGPGSGSGSGPLSGSGDFSSGSRKPYGSSYGSKYNTYYPSYGSYNTFKRERDSSIPTGNASDSIDTSSNGPPNSASNYSRSSDRYDSYSKNYSRPSLNNRSSLSNSITKRDRSRNSSLLNSKRSDTYYPSKSYFSKTQVDHYSTKKKYQYQSSTSLSYPYSNYDSSVGFNQNYNLNYKKSEGDDSSSGLSRKNTESPKEDHRSQDDFYGGYNYSEKDGSHEPFKENTPSNGHDVNGEHYNNCDNNVKDEMDDMDEKDEKDKKDEMDIKDVQDSKEYTDDNYQQVKTEPEADNDTKPVEEGSDDNMDEGYEDEVQTDQIPEEPVAPVQEETKVDVKSPIRSEPLDDIKRKLSDDADPLEVLPMNKMDSLLSDLRKEFKDKQIVSKYSKVYDNIKEYPFYNRNLQIYRLRRPMILSFMSSHAESIRNYKLRLWKEYKQLLSQWEKERVNMDQQLKVLHPPNDEMKRELELADIRIKNQVYGTDSTSPSTPKPNNNGTASEGNYPGDSGNEHLVASEDPNFENTIVTGGFGNRRSSRRHGDLVTTEAEFEEVLKNLSKQDNDDPELKALRVSAPVPDLILDPNQRILYEYLDSNNIVKDKQEWSTRVRTQFFDNFSTEEHALFCEGYVKFPKKFGYISKYMGGLRTTRECVIHYYLTKKGVNYKNLILQYKKKITKKPVNRKKVKSRHTSVNNTPVSSSTTDRTEGLDDSEKYTDNDNEADPGAIRVTVSNPNQSEVFGEALYTDTGRRKRAAAPLFEDGASGSKRSKHAIELEVRGDSPIQQFQTIDVKKRGSRKRKEDQDMILTPKGTPKENGVIDGTGEMAEVAGVDDPMNDPDGKDKNNRNKGHSSYWSITEANEFPILLKQYGKKWTTIADILATKTPTMVRNYYHRNCDKYNWKEIAEDADKRLEQKFAATVSKPEEGSSLPPEQQIESQPHIQSQSQSQPPPFQPQMQTAQPLSFQSPVQGYHPLNSSVMSPNATAAPMLGTFGNLAPFPQHQYPVHYASGPPISGQAPPQSSFQSTIPIHPIQYNPGPPFTQSEPQSQAQHQPNGFPPIKRPSLGSLMNTDKPAIITQGLQPKETQSHKPSIMSLLNDDSPTKSPSIPDLVPPKPDASRNNINSLLNSPSSNENPNTQSQPQPQPSSNSSLPKLSAILAESNDDKS